MLWIFSSLSLGYAAHLKRDPDSYICSLLFNICIFMNACLGMLKYLPCLLKTKELEPLNKELKRNNNNS